jgi:hypothetical protein
LKEFLKTQNRFKKLMRADTEKANTLHNTFQQKVVKRHDEFKLSVMDELELLDKLKLK